MDYSLPPQKCLSITESGDITLREAEADLLIAAQLDWWAERTAENRWRLTEASVSAAARRGMGLRDITTLLESRLARPLPPFLKMALRNWVGSKRTTEASVGPVTLLRCHDDEAFSTIVASQQLKPYLRGQLGPDAVLVDSSQVDKVKRILSWAGVHLQGMVEVEDVADS